MPVRDDLRAKFAVFNPHDQSTHMLPIIYGFNNGGSRDWWGAQLIAEDGMLLGGHVCSHEGYMYGDLGILEGFRADRHEGFRQHYPDGYRMDFVPYEDVGDHAGIQKAFDLLKAKDAKEQTTQTEDATLAE